MIEIKHLLCQSTKELMLRIRTLWTVGTNIFGKQLERRIRSKPESMLDETTSEFRVGEVRDEENITKHISK